MGNPFEELIEKSNTRFDELQGSVNELSQLVKQILYDKDYSVTELAEKTDTSPQTIRKLILKGDIKAERFGRKFIIPHAEFEKACTTVKTLKYKR